MARRSDHTRQQLKDLILDTAWTLIGQDGFEAVTARRVAAEIGYAPGTIYNIFQSMDDLYLQICGRTLDALYDVLNGPACNDPGKTPVENMKAMAALYMKFAAEYRPYWLMLFSHRLPENRAFDGDYQQKIDRLFEPLGRLLSPFFAKDERDKKTIATRVLWSSVHGLCFLQETGKIYIVGEGIDAAGMASYLIDTFVAGIGANA
jgi:AcrR family transcriptional regulator